MKPELPLMYSKMMKASHTNFYYDLMRDKYCRIYFSADLIETYANYLLVFYKSFLRKSPFKVNVSSAHIGFYTVDSLLIWSFEFKRKTFRFCHSYDCDALAYLNNESIFASPELERITTLISMSLDATKSKSVQSIDGKLCTPKAKRSVTTYTISDMIPSYLRHLKQDINKNIIQVIVMKNVDLIDIST